MAKKGRILLTGATGLVGKALMTALTNKGYAINALSRNKQPAALPDIRFFQWDVFANKIDKACLDGVHAIIHLAGENIAALPWSNKRKRLIRDSRTQSMSLLYDLLREQKEHEVTTVISASASGYYGNQGNEWMTEDKPPAADFLGQTCRDWEHTVGEGRELGLRTVSLRSGVILSARSGIFPKFAGFIKKGLGTVPGTGKQWMPWIHLMDAVDMYIFALEHNGIHGAYNMASPVPVTFSQFVLTIAEALKKPLWLPNIPPFLLKAIMGQMSEMLFSSTRMSAEKIQNAGFQFRFPELKDAIRALNPPL